MEKAFTFCKGGGADFFLSHERWCPGAPRQIQTEIISPALLGLAQTNPDLNQLRTCRVKQITFPNMRKQHQRQSLFQSHKMF